MILYGFIQGGGGASQSQGGANVPPPSPHKKRNPDNTSKLVMHLRSNVQVYLLSFSLLFWRTQDSSPAGTIFAEDIEDVQDDYEESQKDSIKV